MFEQAINKQRELTARSVHDDIQTEYSGMLSSLMWDMHQGGCCGLDSCMEFLEIRELADSRGQEPTQTFQVKYDRAWLYMAGCVLISLPEIEQFVNAKLLCEGLFLFLMRVIIYLKG